VVVEGGPDYADILNKKAWFGKVENVAICGGATEHAYDVMQSSVCPGCGNPERMMLGRLLSDEVFHPRIKRALSALRRRREEARK
jgi:hypothetical protein